MTFVALRQYMPICAHSHAQPNSPHLIPHLPEKSLPSFVVSFHIYIFIPYVCGQKQFGWFLNFIRFVSFSMQYSGTCFHSTFWGSSKLLPLGVCFTAAQYSTHFPVEGHDSWWVCQSFSWMDSPSLSHCHCLISGAHHLLLEPWQEMPNLSFRLDQPSVLSILLPKPSM